MLSILTFLFSCKQEAKDKVSITNLNRSNIYYKGQEYTFNGKSYGDVDKISAQMRGVDISIDSFEAGSFSFKYNFEEVTDFIPLSIIGYNQEGDETARVIYELHVVERLSIGEGMFDFSIPQPSEGVLSDSSKLWATNYYLPQVRNDPNGFALRNLDGEPLGPTLSRKNWCDAAMEGSVLVLADDGSAQTYNYAGTSSSHQVDCSMYWRYNSGVTKFRKANGKYGDGVKGYKLIPFRTVAVDKSVYPYGTVLYIPEAVGNKLVLPDGSVTYHDGFFFAGDTGSAIKGNHIDVYTGVSEKLPFDWVRSSSKHTFAAQIVTDPAIIKYMEDLHR
jgi:3D (Asp-Asp-Asp) domain-containing protein